MKTSIYNIMVNNSIFVILLQIIGKNLKQRVKSTLLSLVRSYTHKLNEYRLKDLI